MANSLPKLVPILPEDYYREDRFELPSCGYYEADGGISPIVIKEAAIERAGVRRPTRELPTGPLEGMNEAELIAFAKKEVERKKRYKKNQEDRKRLEKRWATFMKKFDWLYHEDGWRGWNSCVRCCICGRRRCLSSGYHRNKLDYYRSICRQDIYDQVIMFAHDHKGCTRPHLRTESQTVAQYKSPEDEIDRRERRVLRAVVESGIDPKRTYANGVNGRVMCLLCKSWDRFPDNGKDYLNWIREFQSTHQDC